MIPFAFGLSLIALLAMKIEVKFILGLLIAVTSVFYIKHRPKFRIRNVNETESQFNSFLLSTFLVALSCLFLSKSVVFASIFLLVFHEFRRGALFNIAIYTLAASAYFTAYRFLNGIEIMPEHIFFLSLSGGLTAALIESVDTDADKRLTMLLALSSVFTIFQLYIPSTSLAELALAFLISFFISLLALYAGVADESGLMSATLIGTTLILFTDFRFFAVILLFYALGSAVTKYKYSLKFERGIAEQSGGARGYANVFGNSLAALFFAIQYGVYGNEIFAAAFVAAVAEALADTMASEIGKAEEKVYLITNFKRVQPGTSGGISVKGELAALAGSLITAAFAYYLNIMNVETFLIVVLSSFIGVQIDSLLGATIEKKGFLTNSGVNFLGTLSAAIICIFLLI